MRVRALTRLVGAVSRRVEGLREGDEVGWKERMRRMAVCGDAGHDHLCQAVLDEDCRCACLWEQADHGVWQMRGVELEQLSLHFLSQGHCRVAVVVLDVQLNLVEKSFHA